MGICPVAQVPPLGDTPHVTLEIVTIKAGTEAPRIPEPKAGEKPLAAFTLVDRQIEWRVGKGKFDDLRAVTSELRRLWKDPAAQRDDPADPGSRVPVPLWLRPDDNARWVDVVDAMEAARESVFVEIHLVRSDGFEPQVAGLAVREPVRGGGTVIAPRAIYTEPDDGALPKSSLVLHVTQDGRVERGGKTVYDPKRPDDGKALKTLLEGFVRTDPDGFGKRRFGPKEIELSNNYLLVHADKWAPWTSVRDVFRLATRVQPPLYQLYYAAAETDCEARLRAGERFPEPRSAPGGKSDKR